MRVFVQDITDTTQPPHTIETTRAEAAQATYGDRTLDGWSILLSAEQARTLEVGTLSGVYFFPDTDWAVTVLDS